MRFDRLGPLYASALLVCAGAALGSSPPESKKTPTTEQFVQEATEGGLAEIELGNLALKNAKNDAVKQFARRMVDDHSKANDELKALATSKGWTVPIGIGKQQEFEKDRLSKVTGKVFDREYMQSMVKDHEKDIAMFKKYADTGEDPDLKSWAAKTLPTLEEHGSLAASTAKDVGATARAESREGGRRLSHR